MIDDDHHKKEQTKSFLSHLIVCVKFTIIQCIIFKAICKLHDQVGWYSAIWSSFPTFATKTCTRTIGSATRWKKNARPLWKAENKQFELVWALFLCLRDGYKLENRPNYRGFFWGSVRPQRIEGQTWDTYNIGWPKILFWIYSWYTAFVLRSRTSWIRCPPDASVGCASQVYPGKSSRDKQG